MVHNSGQGQPVGETSGERKLDLDREGLEMDIAEARKILWPDKHRRPMGELLDSGFLYRQKLAWGAEHASDPRVREAARVFLGLMGTAAPTAAGNAGKPGETASRTFDLGITLEQARAKLWPFPPRKSQPMGPLVDARELTLKDLAYAVENAWDDGVRKSAMALMLERMDQILKEPPASGGQVEVISSGRSYAKQLEAWLTLWQGVVLGLIVAVIIVLSIWLIRYSQNPPGTGTPASELFSDPLRSASTIVGIVLLLGITWMAIRLPEQIDRRLQKQIDQARRGQEGEDRAVEVILPALDGNWKVFRNVSVPGMKRSDIDIVLVGPPGVWALEVKNLQGEYRNIGDAWEYRHGKVWKQSRAQPSQEARAHAAALGGFLKADGLNVFANPAVVWANAGANLILNNPSVAVWTLDRLADELGNIWYSKRMPRETRAEIVDKLKRLCESQGVNYPERAANRT